MDNEIKEIKKVSVKEYKHTGHEEISIVSYTAEWCGPCRRIKPIFLDIVKNITTEVSNEEISKDDYKKNIHPFIPFFVIKNNGLLVDSIQTSSEEELKTFIKNNTSAERSAERSAEHSAENVINIDEDF